jgi:putative ABC transport system permease protein
MSWGALGRCQDCMAFGSRQRDGTAVAQVKDVLRLVVVEGMRPTLLGILVGSAAALALARALASLFYGVSATDPLLCGAVALLLAGVALLASAGPAWRAARVPPSEALRE